MDLDRKDLVAMIVISILYFTLSTYNLGARQIPVNPWEPPTSGRVVLRLQESRNISQLHTLTGGEKTVRFQIYGGNLTNWIYIASFQGSDYYRWGSIDIDRFTQQIILLFSGNSGEIIEVVLTGQEGEMLALGETDIWLGDDRTYDVTPAHACLKIKVASPFPGKRSENKTGA